MYTTFQKFAPNLSAPSRSFSSAQAPVCADRYLQSSGGIGLLGVALALWPGHGHHGLCARTTFPAATSNPAISIGCLGHQAHWHREVFLYWAAQILAAIRCRVPSSRPSSPKKPGVP